MQNRGFYQGNHEVKSSSQQQMNISQQYGNISQAFRNNQSMIDRPDFTNRGNVIHNNMGESLRDQKITEYKIHIHSKDRNTNISQSPFNFKIPFGSTQSFKIDKKFTHIKYISIDAVILPNTVAIDVSRADVSVLCPTSSEYGEYIGGVLDSTTPLTTLTENKYLVLKIEELGNFRNMGTSSQIDSNTFLLYSDKSMGIDGTLWRPIHSTVVYPTSQPFMLSNMTIKLYDFMDKEIKIVDQNGNDIIKNNISGAGKNYINYVKDNNNSEHVVYTDSVTQMTVMLTIGVIENELSITNS